MNTFINNLGRSGNYTTTENGAITHKTTLNAVYDLFAFGGSYRKRSDEDCITLFKNAFEEDKELALKCLFYLRDIAEGAGERRFFRVCYNWLCQYEPEIAQRNMEYIAADNFGRWDDVIYSSIDTKSEECMINILAEQIVIDLESENPSLLAKWMPSCNTSSKKTREIANKIRERLGYSHKEYRKMLSKLRKRINIVERLMSANEWDKIEFDKIPSKAGLLYKDAFERREIIAEKYKEFAKSDNKVNAQVLYPQEVISEIFKCDSNDYKSTERLMIQKYWDNLKDIYQGRTENAIAVCDVSGSMWGKPIEAALGLSAYIAERNKGAFNNYFITFSATPELVKFKGVDITDKIRRAETASWGMNTDIQAVFDLLLNTIKDDNIKKEDIPERLYIFSDMEFDGCLTENWHHRTTEKEVNTLLEKIAEEWEQEGFELPQLIFWNLDARQENIPMLKGARFGYISGFSSNMIDCILTGKDGYDLVLEKLNSDRYKKIK